MTQAAKSVSHDQTITGQAEQSVQKYIYIYYFLTLFSLITADFGVSH